MSKGLISIAPFHLCIAAKAGNQFRNAVPYWNLLFMALGEKQRNREVSIMANHKRKLTAAEKAEKKRRQKEFMTIFINGKQKRVRRPPTIDGIGVDDFIRRNADPIWLHQNEMWEFMTDDEES
jgi:hypothetical protein